ncbi:helix-turn-helix domain-containing protein [Inquilinus sp. YAF38]|uniref:helix-turn-helix domain-containing protein n=1 Tax=Inquilinus sp. YAF38 TaxID=3233084 RepID=UPI003F9009EE
MKRRAKCAASPGPVLHDLSVTAEMLGGISLRTLRRMIEDGRIRTVLVGRRRVMVARVDIDAFVAAARLDRPANR